MKIRYILSMVLLLTCLGMPAQRVFNLTAEQVRVDTLLPLFTYSHPLGHHYADSAYTVTIEYPEYIPMSEADVLRYRQLSDAELPPMPQIHQSISVSRKQGSLDISFVPLVCRGGQYQKLVSFMVKVQSAPIGRQLSRLPSRLEAAADGYAPHSVLATGTWAKIRVPASGVYQLTDELVRQAGFGNASKVKVYGYGGAMQPERLTSAYLQSTDDLREVATCTVGGRRLFYAQGPVSWDSNHLRIRNPYSDYGYYFLTESDDEPLTVGEDEFVQSFYPAPDDYHSLYEVDDYAWYHGGRNLYDAQLFALGQPRQYTLTAAGGTGFVYVVLSAHGQSVATVSVNGEEVGTMSIPSNGTYEEMRTAEGKFSVSSLQPTNTVTITQTSGGEMRLDYISLYCTTAKATPDLAAATFPAPEYVYRIANQDHHADEAVDMVILVPTSQKLVAQAERVKQLHEQRDGLRVRIVPADELYNEFASGTPDANAYRRYLKMLYDRATTDDDMPRYLLLFGDGAWDNRMLSASWRGYSPDDFLLCYESDNSYSHTACFVSDDYFCLLDDGEGASIVTSDKPDVAVGRFPVRTDDEATTLVDKTISYANNQYAGDWQNVICFMGDDGNNNQHMEDADTVARMVEQLYPNFQVKRIMWDAYTRVTTSTGSTYPDVTRLIKQQMQSGALMMNYCGHGAAYALSHELVLRVSDFQTTTSNHLPLWLTASCDIMPFDGQEENIGETALFNKKGGAVAFYGTTRTVYSNYNRLMNLAFTRYALGTDEQGRRISVGEAARLAKNYLVNVPIQREKDLTTNKLQYTLLGDPALVLSAPTGGVAIDSINGQAPSAARPATLKAGETVVVKGRILDEQGARNTSFDGVLTATVRDAEELIVCKLNDQTKDGASEAFTYYDRPNILYNGSDSVRRGEFSFTFAVPKDISYADASGLINVYAVNSAHTEEASGTTSQFLLGGTGMLSRDSIGPSIYCYLNSSDFSNGGSVNPTPYFVAQLSDEDGINSTGNGIGHDLELIIDGDMSKTYVLNDYFQYDFGSYTTGTVGYSIPELAYGDHKLLFRAWDVLNNSSTAELSFRVVKGLEPAFVDVECTRNPASTTTSFRILHDRQGSTMDIVLDVFDLSGRHLWQHSEGGVMTDNTYTIDWDLCVDGGRRLHTGVYLYRLRLSSDGSTYATKAKKLIVLTTK